MGKPIILRLLSLIIFASLSACARSPEFWQTYSATTTAAALVGQGGIAPALTPLPGSSLIDAEYQVTQAAINLMSAQTTSDQTRTAYEYESAITTLSAQHAIATQVAPMTYAAATSVSIEQTRQVGEMATQASAMATIQQSQVNVAIAEANAQMTIQSAIAQGTATAIAEVALIEQQARLAQQQELEIANQKARNRATMGWAIPVGILAIAGLIALPIAYRIVIQAKPHTTTTGQVVTWDRAGSPMISAPSRRLMIEPGGIQKPDKADDTPDFSDFNGVFPDIIRNVLQIGTFEDGRPIHLGAGFMGIQLTGRKGSGKSSLLRLMAAQSITHGWDTFYCDAEALTFDPSLWGPVAQTTADARLLFGKVERKWYRTHEAFLKALDNDAKARKTWKIEVVQLTTL